MNKTDVFCLINKNYDAVYNYLKTKLTGEQDLIFAERRQGAGYFLWRHPDNDWLRLSTCDPEEKGMLYDEFEAVKARIKAKLKGDALLDTFEDKVFSVPDESFIWYKNDLDGIRFLLTGWGYKYPLAAGGGPIVEGTEEDSKQDVHVGFSYQGTMQPQMEFTIGPKASASNKHFTTDDSGMAYVGKLHADVTYAILFLAFGKSFNLNVQEGKEEYIFDVTRKALLTITATRDGNPISGAVCTIRYAGNQNEIPFPKNGTVMQTLTLDEENGKALVSVDGEYKELALEEGDNYLYFEFHSPVAEEPAPSEFGTPFVRVVDAEGNPKSGHPMTATIEGTIYSFETDEEGRFALPSIQAGSVVFLEDGIDKSHSDSYTIDDVNGEHIFVIPNQVKEGDLKWDCVLKLRNWTGFPIRKGAILYQQEGRKDVLAQIDTKGRTYLCYEDFRIDDTITANFQIPGYELDPVPFSLSKEHNKYLFRIRKMNFWIVLLYVLVGLLVLYVLFWLFWVCYPW